MKRKYFATECQNAWRDFGHQPGIYLRWGRARRGPWGDDRYELRTREQQTIASLYLGKLPSTFESFAGANLGGRSFTKTRAARSLPLGIAGAVNRPGESGDLARDRHPHIAGTAG